MILINPKVFRRATPAEILLGFIKFLFLSPLYLEEEQRLKSLILSTGQKFNGVKKGLRIEMKVKDEVTQEIKATTKNAFR